MHNLKPPKLTYITGQCNNPHTCDSTELVKEGQETWCRKCCWRQNTIRAPHKSIQEKLIKGMPAAEYHRRWNQSRLLSKKAPCKCGCGREVSLIGNQKYATKECQRAAQTAQRQRKAARRFRMGMAV